MPAAEMLKMQPARVEHSVPICGLLWGNKNTKELVTQGCSQSPQVVCLVFWSTLWLVIGGKFFTIARTLVLLRPHPRLQLHFGQMEACCSPSPGLCQWMCGYLKPQTALSCSPPQAPVFYWRGKTIAPWGDPSGNLQLLPKCLSLSFLPIHLSSFDSMIKWIFYKSWGVRGTHGDGVRKSKSRDVGFCVGQGHAQEVLYLKPRCFIVFYLFDCLFVCFLRGKSI